MRRSLLTAAMLLCASAAQAHQQWADGSRVPPWVKSLCCGEADAHRDPTLHRRQGRVYVDDLTEPVDEEKIFDSQDGHIWAFYAPSAGPMAVTYCLFVPPAL